MFSNNKSANINLEQGSIDFGNNKLNEIYASFDEDTKSQINKIQNKEIQISLLKDISNEKLNKIFETLSNKEKDTLKNMGIRDKYRFLKVMYNKQNQTKSEKYTPVSPDFPPPQKEKSIEEEFNIVDAPQELLIEEEEEQPIYLQKKINLTPQEQQKVPVGVRANLYIHRQA
jgi:hypothetical protein